MWQAYKRSRLIHINVNITVAALSALAISSIFVYLTRYITNHAFVIVILSYVVDGIIDIGIFALLHAALYHHWLKDRSFTKMLAQDLALIQAHRLILSIVVTVISIGGHYLLLKQGVARVPAFLIAYVTAIAAARTIHTIYGLKTGLFTPLRDPRKKNHAAK